MKRLGVVLVFFFLLVPLTNGFLRIPGDGSSLFPHSPIHCGESELPPNKDYKSPLTEDSSDSFIDSLKKSVNNFREEATAGSEANVPTSQDSTELPLSFEDAVARAAKLCARGIRQGGLDKLRIDFDTSVGDMTYTTLKNTLPMARQLSIELDELLGLSPKTGVDSSQITTKSSPAEAAPVSTEELDPEEAAELAAEMAEMAEIAAAEGLAPSDNIIPAKVGIDISGPGDSCGTMRLFFPDMGAAALARRDWKMGTPQAEVPASVRTANIQNDPLETTDKLAILLCPLSYEIDSVKRVKDICEAANIPCIMINPNLINMDQGFGYRARELRNNLIVPFTMMYKLKTLSDGAIVREYPKGYSLWMEDEGVEDSGYRLLQSFVNDPPNEVVMDLLDLNLPPKEEEGVEESGASKAAKGVFKEVSSFFEGLSKL